MPQKGTHISRETGYTEAEVQALLRRSQNEFAPAKMFEAMKPMMLDFFLPVGTVIECVDNVHPKDKYGGEWEQIKDVFTLAAGDTYTAGSTGGEAEHLLTGAESGQKALTNVGSHHHPAYFRRMTANSFITSGGAIVWGSSANNNGTWNTNDATISISASNAASAHNNMPPYLVTYKWKRIA